uniref:Uncharacterized protein n=1 Tax=Panagrolaimus davidi TaxID=227884 RepID=A0A914PQK8_9BILA
MSDSKFDRSRFYYGENNPKLLIGDFWDENYSDVQHLLWHTDKLQIMHYNDRYLEKSRIPKFYRCSIKELELYKTVLSVNDFLLITAEKQIQRFTIHRDSWIWYPDYSKVDIAEIFKFEVMPKLKFLVCYRSATNCTNEIFEKLSKIQLQTKLSEFYIKFGNAIPENEFKGEYLFEFIKNNAEQKKTTVISFEAYNDKLQPFLHEIVERWEDEILKVSE